MTIDHLRVDHRITVLRKFTDAAGTTMNANETGVIRVMSFDQLRQEIHIEIARDAIGGDVGRVRLMFLLKAQSGPRNGHIREFFELAEFVALPGAEPVRRAAFHGSAHPTHVRLFRAHAIPAHPKLLPETANQREPRVIQSNRHATTCEHAAP